MASETTAQYPAAPGQPKPHSSGATAVLLDFVERAGWSAGEAFFAALLAGGTAVLSTGLPWGYASLIAASAAVSSVILTGVQYLTKLTDLSGVHPPALRFWVDLLIRLVKTFVASLAGSIAAEATFNVATFSWTQALNVAALAVLAALGKCLLARGASPGTPTGAAPTPSTLPTPTYLAAVGQKKS